MCGEEEGVWCVCVLSGWCVVTVTLRIGRRCGQVTPTLNDQLTLIVKPASVIFCLNLAVLE